MFFHFNTFNETGSSTAAAAGVAKCVSAAEGRMKM
jgi:hypothetical protein